MDVPLDVSALEPPEPMRQILEALFDLADSDRLCVQHRREPFPLYSLLRRMGYRWRTEGEDGRYELLIWSGDEPLQPKSA